LRFEEERQIIKRVIERHIQKIHINLNEHYDRYISKLLNGYSNVKLSLNNSSKTMITLIDKSFRNREPVLLIGETGIVNRQHMITINCYENIDTSDFLDSFRYIP
jgi:transcriptional regulator of acetoin/glycerol metabolism